MHGAARSALAFVWCVPVLLGAQRLGAQRPAAADTARPAFENLRYREDWSRRHSGDFFDPIKHIDLFGGSYLSLGGSARFRAERDANFLGGGSGTRDDSFGSSRAYLYADIHGSYGTRVFLEGRVARAQGRDLPGGDRARDRDDLDWNNLFGEVTRGLPGVRATARYGRQELLLGRERLVSPSDWSNVRRSFEGAVLEIQQQAVLLTAMYVHPIVASPTDKNRPDNRTTLYGGYLTWGRESPALFEAFVLAKRIDAIGASERFTRTTIGVRVIQPLIAGWQAEIEAGVQLGSMGDTSIRANMIATDFTRRWTGRWSPSLTLGADRSSGTSSGHAAQSGTWDVLYALAHSYVGYADVLARRNVTELRAVAQASPATRVRLRAAAHLFRRTSDDDGTYDTSGSPAHASLPGASMNIGSELDVTAQWRLQRHLRLDAGGALFTPGTFMKDAGAGQTYTWAFASVTATF